MASPWRCCWTWAFWCFVVLSFHGSHAFDIKYPSQVLMVTPDNYNSTVIDSKEWWVVDFFAPWCPHCRDFAPVYGEVAVQLEDAKDVVRFGACDCVANYDMCKDVNITGFPTTRIFHAGELVHHNVGEENVTSYIDWIKTKLPHSVIHYLNDHATVTMAPTKPPGDRWNEKNATYYSEVPLADLSITINFSLRRSVFFNNEAIDGAKLQTLQAWLSLLRRTLPFKKGDTFHKLEFKVAAMKKATQKVWKKITNDLVVFGSKQGKVEPVLCNGPTHGYSCGLWLLFHTVLQRCDSDQHAVHAFHTIREYIATYFKCASCEHHFKLATADWRKEVTTHRAAIMYLWKIHNNVTDRLALKHGYLGDTYFPPAKMCPHCRTGGKFPDVQWDHDKVFKLLSVYCLGDAKCASSSASSPSSPARHRMPKAPSKFEPNKVTHDKASFSGMMIPGVLIGVGALMLGAGVVVCTLLKKAHSSNVHPGGPQYQPIPQQQGYQQRG